MALFDFKGQLLGQVARRNVDHRAGTRQWQVAETWWQNCVDSTRQILQQQHLDPARVKGCSLSGRAGAAVFVDDSADVLCDPWLDTRHNAELRTLVDGRSRNEVAMYGAALLSKIMWLRHDSPDLAARIAHVLYAKDFLLYRLTGEAVTDPSSGPDGPGSPGRGRKCGRRQRADEQLRHEPRT